MQKKKKKKDSGDALKVKEIQDQLVQQQIQDQEKARQTLEEEEKKQQQQKEQELLNPEDLENLIPLEELIEILKQSYELMCQEYIELQKHSRDQRRQIKSIKKAEYIQCILTYKQQNEILFQNCQKKILLKHKYCLEQLDYSIEKYSQNGTVTQQKAIFKALSDFQDIEIPSEIQIDMNTLLKCLEYQNEVLNTDLEYIYDLHEKLPEKEDKEQEFEQFQSLLLAYIEDRVYEKYKYEKYDINNSLKLFASGKLVQIQLALFQSKLNEIYEYLNLTKQNSIEENKNQIIQEIF